MIGYVGVMLRLCSMLEVLMQKNETIAKYVETQAKEMEMSPEDLAIYQEEEEKNVGGVVAVRRRNRWRIRLHTTIISTCFVFVV